MRRIFYFGILLHIIVLYGGIDLNFISPLQNDLPQFNSTDTPPANRLVLIVADGLRDERLTVLGSQNVTPYLMDIKLRRGAAGVAISSVPTESRPGHVSLLAGIYEDPSAIFKGWQDNPVKFDSVINQSTWTFGWGSHDILDLFNKDEHPHVHFWSYPREMQAFEEPSIELDRWVLANVEDMFNGMIEEDCGVYCTRKHMHPWEVKIREIFFDFMVKTGCKKWCGKKTIFFLHLLGMDNAGHVYKPHSEKYVENLRFVDHLVERVEERFDSFIDDGKTTFIFTADHGMTNWGSHGSGSEHETHVPVLAWGAGIKPGPKHKIRQLDLAPLMAALIGIKIPTNSLGRLPLDYLNVTESVLAEMVLNNVKQSAALYRRLEESRKDIIGFTPFSYFSKNDSLEKELNEIIKLIEAADYESAITDAKFLLNVLEQGRKYYLNYYKGFMVRCLAVAVFIWFLYLSAVSTRNYEDDLLIRLFPERSYIMTIKNIPILNLLVYLTGVIVLPLAISSVYLSNLPLTTYLYVSLPILCTMTLLWNYEQVLYAVSCLEPIGFPRWILQLILYSSGLLLLICSFSDRVYFVPILIVMAIWGWCYNRYFTLWDRIFWTVICGSFCVFSVLPSVVTSVQLAHAIGVGVWIFVIIMAVIFVFKNDALKEIFEVDTTAMIGILVMSTVFLMGLSLGFGIRYNTDGISFIFCIFNWYLIGLGLMVPFVTLQIPLFRLILWLFGFMTYYAFVAVHYELLYMLAYVALLIQWIILEDKIAFYGYSTFIAAIKGEFIHDEVYRRHDIGQQLVRRAFFYLTFALLGFFGTGNFAELSSFDPMWVKPLITSFNPFAITFLIILKLSIPIMLCTITLYVINVVTPGRVGTLFAVMMAICELMLINFLLNIRTEGSWLDIGTSLSKFIICGVLTLVVMLYYQVSHHLMNFRTI